MLLAERSMRQLCRHLLKVFTVPKCTELHSSHPRSLHHSLHVLGHQVPCTNPKVILAVPALVLSTPDECSKHQRRLLRHILVECCFGHASSMDSVFSGTFVSSVSSDTMGGSFFLFTFSEMGWSTEKASEFMFSVASTSSAS